MAQASLTMAQLIASRICHDLISPVGAIANGMELVALSGGAATPELELISSSVNGANARIKFYRVALGMASAEQNMGASELTSILSGFYADTRLTCEWSAEGDIPRKQVQAAFLALLCLGSAMPVGGTLTVSNAGGQWLVAAQANQMRNQPELWEHLDGTGDVDKLQPSEVQFAMLPQSAAALGRPITHELGETRGVIRF